MTDEQARELGVKLGQVLGQVLLYKLMRRWGAPRWAAWAVAVTNGQLDGIRRAVE